MRFVWITKEVPLNPDNGLRIYSNGLLSGLLRMGATGTLIAYKRKAAEGASLPGLEILDVSPTRRIRLFSLASRLHSDAYQLRSRPFTQAVLQSLASPVDVVVIDYFAMGWILPAVRKALAKVSQRPVLVYVAHNHEAVLRADVARSIQNPLLRGVLSLDAGKAARLETSLISAADLIVANTLEDMRSIGNCVPGKRILPLSPGYDGEIRPTRPITAGIPRLAVIVGSFEWIAKQANLRKFLRIADDRFRKAGIQVRVVGRAPAELIAELGSLYPWCTFTGPVEDVRPFLPEGRIGIMPDDVGGGFKHKYLYYIFSGVPIAAIRSQIAGLPIDLDRDLLARETMTDLVDAVVESIDDLPLLEGMRIRCWEACAGSFSWEQRGRELYDAILEVLRAPMSPGCGLPASRQPETGNERSTKLG